MLVATAGCAGQVGQAAPETARAMHAPNPRADRSYYIAMRDGVRIAISYYFPGRIEPITRRPTILVQTRYGRAGMLDRFQRFVDDGYVLAVVDTRGSTSSFGPRGTDIGPDEIADMDEIIAEVAAQPWSDGHVFAQGTSYMADTADIATSRPAPALSGAIIREVDFDVFLGLFFPGGVGNFWFLEGWGSRTQAYDEGRDPEAGLDCRLRVEDCPRLWPVLDPVDGDEDYKLLRAALAGRHRWVPGDYENLEFYYDASARGYRIFDSTPAAHLAGIRRAAVPAQVWGSWVDAGTAEAALARYRSAPGVPMEIWITGNDHGNEVFGDPFAPGGGEPLPSLDRQHEIMTGFYESVMAGSFDDRRIHYYVLGTGEYRETPVWPPRGVESETFYLAGASRLSRSMPKAGRVTYNVDFSAATGQMTRWSTQGGAPPAYPDRREADGKLIVFDSSPFAADMELAGTPVIDLRVATATADPVFHVYLEDVAPDGRVTYLTEGLFRAIHRAPADPATLPYDMGPAPHSYRREDALPVTPGETMELRFALLPVAARIGEGHRLRVAIAGADASYFRRYSQGRDEVFDFALGGESASAISVPLRLWSKD